MLKFPIRLLTSAATNAPKLSYLIVLVLVLVLGI
jgi:hypothetical protein